MRVRSRPDGLSLNALQLPHAPPLPRATKHDDGGECKPDLFKGCAFVLTMSGADNKARDKLEKQILAAGATLVDSVRCVVLCSPRLAS